jgi:hypothetical protein
MTQYSYRKFRLFAILVFAAYFAASAHAQYGKRDEPVLRGTAVLESQSEGWRLIPVCIFSAGKFYDADFYQSTPAPMSLIQGTVYEVQKSGVPVGNFTVGDAERLGAAWYGRGRFNDFSAKPEKIANASAAKSSIEFKPSGPDDRPVLRRSTPAPKVNPDGTTQPASVAPTPDSAQMANNDPDRPTLRRGTQAPKPDVSGPREDPQAKAESERRTRVLNVAVSDASTRSTRPFDYRWDDDQKKQLTEGMSRLAAAELTKVAKSRGVTFSPKEEIEFAETAIRAYDVDYSNSPQLIFTARFIPTPRQLPGMSKESAAEIMKGGIYVTAVARVNYNAELERIFANVSDPRDLDASPRLEFVDAVDVDADNRAELLFAKDSEAGRRFVIYRLYGLRMNEIFTSGVR